MHRTFKYRLYPNKIQRERLDQSLDLLRVFYNAALQERRDAWKLNRVRISLADQSRQIPDIRSCDSDYFTVQARTMTQTLRQLERAFAAFFRRVKNGEKPGYPRFKGKSFFNSLVYNQTGFRFRGNRLNLSLIGDLKIKISRPIEGRIKEIVTRREGEKWFAIITCSEVPARPLPATNSVIGIDAGIESFATLSDGTHIANNRFYESSQKRLRKAQRKLSRRKKFSNRWKKAVVLVRSIHATIARQRADFHHKLSTRLVRGNDLIAVENLNTKGMCRGIIRKHIHDVGWTSFFDMIAYKAESAGRVFVKVNPSGTSQTCLCGAEVRKDLSVRWHDCSECGLSEHRDIVSAKIILARGLRVQALT